MKTVRRIHHMPVGAELSGDGHVNFQLWAPGATQVDVCLLDTEKIHPLQQYQPHHFKRLVMNAEDEGWYRLVTDTVGAGALYAFLINEENLVPDPAARFQPGDVHGPSEIINPENWAWHDHDWQGRPWEETIIYELHIGCYTPQGTFLGLLDKLDYLVELGVSAIEIMPVGDFPGRYNWGYDGTYLFAPDSRYGRPEDFKYLIDAAHEKNIMVFLDVVYNHFGPEGNYLNIYAPQFFSDTHVTPWGKGINYDGKQNKSVRLFYIHNALYWLEEYHLDGLRLDAVHAIDDDSQPDIISELAQAVHNYFPAERHIHLMLENDHNASRFLARDKNGRPLQYTAQWNDDMHHAIHTYLTQENDRYYIDYALDPIRHLGRCLTYGFSYQGEYSIYREGQIRGEPSGYLPPTAFIAFLQNHDQVGNRIRGERIATLVQSDHVQAVMALLLLLPSPPLLFMGEEWGCTQPFHFFCDFEQELNDRVIFSRLTQLKTTPGITQEDPVSLYHDLRHGESFFNASVIDWPTMAEARHGHWLTLYRNLLKLRKAVVIPRLPGIKGHQPEYHRMGPQTLSAQWILGDGSKWTLFANLHHRSHPSPLPCKSHLTYSTHIKARGVQEARELPPWSVTWYLQA